MRNGSLESPIILAGLILVKSNSRLDKMKRSYSYLIFSCSILFLLIACNTPQSTVSGSVADSWQDSMASNTTKIKVVTRLDNKNLRRKALELCEKHKILLDVQNSTSQQFYSVPKGHPYERLSMQFQDSIVFLSAEKQRSGLNDTKYWEASELNTAEWRLSTQQIELVKTGFPGAKIFYNKPVRN